ncbi:MAG: LicD family protein, partial [Ruminococcus sp.]|nr:LicD family protein [Ruminococcus sp.]
MLNADVQQDYRNDWIKRCLNIKGIDYSSFSQKNLCWFADRNCEAYDVMQQIFADTSDKYNGFSVALNSSCNFMDLVLCWDLSFCPLNQEQLDQIRHIENNILFVTDKPEFTTLISEFLSEKVTVLYCGQVYGAGLNDNEASQNNCTNILDFLAAQIYMISKNIPNEIYYAGHGECTDIKAKILQDTGYSPMISYDDGKYMLDFSRERPDEYFYFDNTYNDNLRLLHQLLFNCLIEFDRICKKHNIKYFLGGGTLLGAIRHGGMIPWDDDMDVMMLREDYEKFISVINDELCDEMFFQSSKTDSEYHSVFTKIRLNGTLFVTRYSQQFKNMHQGIFIDIFVHDHTSNSKLGQKIHVFKTLFARSLVFHKWAKTPMHFYGKLKLICKLATKYINRSSMDKLEAIQDRV